MKKNVILIGLLLSCLMFNDGCSRFLDILKSRDSEDRPQLVKDVSVAEASALVQQHKNDANFVILDVRTAAEFSGGHIENANNLDYYSTTFKDDLSKYNHNKIYLIYCKAGGRSAQATNIAKELGFKEVYNMLGGITAWINAGYPVVKG
jgi:rhodanese-related sulfurtransferase